MFCSFINVCLFVVSVIGGGGGRDYETRKVVLLVERPKLSDDKIVPKIDWGLSKNQNSKWYLRLKSYTFLKGQFKSRSWKNKPRRKIRTETDSNQTLISQIGAPSQCSSVHIFLFLEKAVTQAWLYLISIFIMKVYLPGAGVATWDWASKDKSEKES